MDFKNDSHLVYNDTSVQVERYTANLADLTAPNLKAGQGDYLMANVKWMVNVNLKQTQNMSGCQASSKCQVLHRATLMKTTATIVPPAKITE